MRRVGTGQRRSCSRSPLWAPTAPSGPRNPALPAAPTVRNAPADSLMIHTCAPARPPVRPPGPVPEPLLGARSPLLGGQWCPARLCLRAVRTDWPESAPTGPSTPRVRPDRPESGPTPQALPREQGRAEGSGPRPLLPPRGPLGWSGGGAGQRGPEPRATPRPSRGGGGGWVERSPGEAGSALSCSCQRGAVQSPPVPRQGHRKAPGATPEPPQGHRKAPGATSAAAARTSQSPWSSLRVTAPELVVESLSWHHGDTTEPRVPLEGHHTRVNAELPAEGTAVEQCHSNPCLPGLPAPGCSAPRQGAAECPGDSLHLPCEQG